MKPFIRDFKEEFRDATKFLGLWPKDWEEGDFEQAWKGYMELKRFEALS